MPKHLPLVAALLLVAAPAHAQKRAFTLEEFYRVRSLGDVQVSADGANAAYTVTTSDLPRAKRATQVWLMELGTDTPVSTLDGAMWLRLSVQAYNELEDYERLAGLLAPAG